MQDRRARRPAHRIAWGLLALAALPAVAAAATPVPAPGTGSLWGRVDLAARQGVLIAQDGNPYGGAAHGIPLVDYSRPGFAVVHLVGGQAPAGREAVVFTEHGFVRQTGVVGSAGIVALRNEDLRPHTFSVPSAAFFRRLASHEEAEIAGLPPGALEIFVLDGAAETVLFVASGPYSLVTPEGRWHLADLPPGPAIVRAWHPRLPGEERQVMVRAGRAQRIRLRIGVDAPIGPAGGGAEMSGSAVPAHTSSGLAPEPLALATTRPRWLDRIRVSGTANVGYFGGEQGETSGIGPLAVDDARYFLAVDLGHSLWLGDTKILRSATYHYEREVYRIGYEKDEVGDHYLDLRGVFDSDWLNLHIGRFQLPVSENYLRFGKGQRSNPFVSNALGAPWYDDEGVKLWGAGADSGLGYVLSLTDGEAQVSENFVRPRQLTLKVFADLAPWLHVSASGLHCGEIGSAGTKASSSIWFGESWIQPLGHRTSVPNYHHGQEIPDGPPVVSRVDMLAADAVIDFRSGTRLWLAAGDIDVEQPGGGLHDRDLRYWLAEGQWAGASLSPSLEPLQLALRLEGYGTFDGDEGYLLDFRRRATLGYNMRSISRASLAASWRLRAGFDLRADYSRTEVDLVRGTTPEMRAAAGASRAFALTASLAF